MAANDEAKPIVIQIVHNTEDKEVKIIVNCAAVFNLQTS